MGKRKPPARDLRSRRPAAARAPQPRPANARRTKREPAAAAPRSRLQTVIDSIFGFVGVFSTDGTVVEANQPPLDMAGVSREDVIGRPFWDTYWWSYSATVQDRLRDAMRSAALGESVR